MKSPIEAAKRLAGYVERSEQPDTTCRACAQSRPRDGALRCGPGGFYVRPTGTCRQFTHAPLVQIGPTDI